MRSTNQPNTIHSKTKVRYRASGKTAYQLSKQSETSPDVIHRKGFGINMSFYMSKNNTVYYYFKFLNVLNNKR